MSTWFPAAVYLLCFLTSAACALLLVRSYRRTGARLLFWSGLCFWGLTVANALALVDVYVVHNVDLYWTRLTAHLLSVGVLLYGMIWESK